MSQVSREHVIQTLAAVEAVRQQQGLSRHQLADRLGIPFETFRRWFHKSAPKRPSAAHLSRLDAYVTNARGEVSEWDRVWEAIRSWWQNQHRYNSAADLAREIGWHGDHLDRCLKGAERPPRLVLERLADTLRIATPASPPPVGEARRRTDRLRALLMLLYEELSWFRDGPKEVRAVYRSELDAFDAGYLSSLLAMLSDESKFKRWLAATTNRFASFERKGGRP